MGTASIRQAIADAIDSEQRDQALHHVFARQLDSLRTGLLLPRENAAEALVSFTCRYINYVPDFLDLIDRRIRESGNASFATPFVHMAEDFFLAPMPVPEGQSTLKSLLEEAFLAHRLMEEVNDLHTRLRGVPLVAVDVTRANIIVHHVIGDRVASCLEALVNLSIAAFGPQDRLFAAPASAAAPLNRVPLPCMSEGCNIDLRLAGFPAQSSTGFTGDD